MSSYDQTVLGQADPTATVMTLTSTGEPTGFWRNVVDTLSFGLLAAGNVGADLTKRFYLVGGGDQWEMWTVDRKQQISKLDVSQELRGNPGSKKLIVNHQAYKVVGKLQ